MNALSTSAVSLVALLLAVSSHAQLGASREQLVNRYGSCTPDTVAAPNGPNAYDSVMDVGRHCHFADGPFRVTALFKSDRVVGFYFTKSATFWQSLRHSFKYPYLPLSDTEISSLLHSAAPGVAAWIAGQSDDGIRRWRTSDGSAAAYYFAGGHGKLYHLIVQTAAVDDVFRKVEGR